MLRIAVVALLSLAGAFAHAQQPPSVIGRSWVLADLSSGQMLASEKPDERFEPASLTKLMTAYLVFTALKEKKLELEQQVSVSERAWRAPGSRMFVDPRKPVMVQELIRGMVVQSGNDACIALAEAVAGSEDVFAQMMNREAARLGMKSTKFMNASGLPDPQHYSTAHDLHLLAAALIRDFPEQYAQYYSQKEFRYNNITQPNRNRLLWLDPTVDGVKTGFTEAAGYCLIASSRRGPRRLLSVPARLDFGIHPRTGVAEAAQLGIPVLRCGEALRQGAAGEGNRGVEGREAPREGGIPERFRRHRAERSGGEAQGGTADAVADHCAGGRRAARRRPARFPGWQAARRIPRLRAGGHPAGRIPRPRLGYTETLDEVRLPWFF